MATRDAFIYQEPSDKCIDGLDKFLRGLGFSVEDTHGAVHVIDGEGDDHIVSMETLSEETAEQDSLSMLLWHSEAECLYCRIRYVGRLRVVELDLRGTEPSFRQMLAGKLIETALEPTFRGLVFDPEGLTEDYNWDGFFSDNAMPSATDLEGRLPELLLITSKLAARVVGFNLEPWGHDVARVRQRAHSST